MRKRRLRAFRPRGEHLHERCLPSGGPVIARRIIEGRPYRSVEELDRVKGIGKKRLEEIRPLVRAE